MTEEQAPSLAPALILLPTPRGMESLPGTLRLDEPLTIVLPQAHAHELLGAARHLQELALSTHASHWPITASPAAAAQGEARVLLLVDASIGNRERYELRIAPEGITIRGASPAAVFYGLQTLGQLLRQSRDQLPCLMIQDHPDFPARGVMLDISRDKVPSMQTLLDLVDLLASWKINQLQLYMEHTFAYSRHREVWATASPLTAQELLELDAYCRDRFIELVPNQNSFGHMERWLNHPRYKPLAEAPDGAETPWNFRWPGPFSLCPTDPQSLELLAGLYDELLPNFTSRLFNVGCDETFDIGQGRSKAQCEGIGKHRVYLEFLRKLHGLVQDRGRRMMFWGDIILHQPELIAELPKDLIAMEWGYEAGHPFDREGALFAQANVPFYVCPGTSSWCSIAGRTDNCLANLKNAAANGRKHGAIGYLITDWGDYGHMQYLPISYLGFAAGAAYSWCLKTNANLPMAQALDTHAFLDDTGVMGLLVMDLGNVYRQLPLISNASGLFRILCKHKNKQDMADVTGAHLDAASAAIDAAMKPLAGAAMKPLAGASMRRPDAALVIDEMRNTAAVLRHACARGRWLLDPASVDPLTLGADILFIVGEHDRLWLARNRIGGLAESRAHLTKLLLEYAQ